MMVPSRDRFVWDHVRSIRKYVVEVDRNALTHGPEQALTLLSESGPGSVSGTLSDGALAFRIPLRTP